ncbi:MAG: ABC transporter permease [Nitrospiraceae bacterium]|nr:ABC transporter permease [Nitrospiraceae bacterium]
MIPLPMLDRKLLRDLWKMKGQALAIVLVIVSGVATYVMLIGTMDSLNMTRDRFYRDHRFADVFAQLKRAPDSVKAQIAEIPGIGTAETRVAADVKLDIKGFPEPVTARIVSLPDVGQPLLNTPYIRKGRMLEPYRSDEVLVSEAFAEAHRLSPGDTFGAVINGRWKTLVIVGTALSPEFVLQSRPGAISPDYKRYAILWMGRDGLGTAYNMKGAFNDVILTLSRGARAEDVILRLDSLLDRYGGLGAYARKEQISHRFLSEEFKQLQRSADIFPAIFIAVSAFLLNVVVSRTVGIQRDQIAILKAFGYSNLGVGVHYTKMVLVIVVAGIAGGLAAGTRLGEALGGVYMAFYRFPYLVFELRPGVALTAAGITTAAALAGTFFSVHRAATLPPAEAMRPEPPALYRRSIVERLGIGRLLAQPTRMILRNIGKRPARSLLMIAGVALSCAIMIAATFSKDAVDFMVDVQFTRSQKEDLTVTFTDPTSKKAVYELMGLRGVTHAEVFRSVPARLRFGHRSYRTSIQGIEPGGSLNTPLDSSLRPISLPEDGIVLNDYLGAILGIRPGDMLTVEVLEGNRPVRQVPVVGLVKQYIGLQGYMDIHALNRLMKEGGAISGAYLSVDPRYRAEVYKTLVEMPRVAGAVVRKEEIRNFYDTQAEALLFFTFIATILGGTIAFGVVYNSARIALSERSRELASLRVLGYTRAEISYIFLGELGLITIASIPLGMLMGREIASYIARAISSELFRVPMVIGGATYSLAAAVVVVSACFSGLIVRHRLDHLDLVAVLKARE